ncbi:MAG: translation initiation factor IF-2 subunit alpha [Pyrodictiaceae archaeon]
MALRKKELPDIGELVVGTVREVYDYGAYLTLDEYGGLEAYLPWSEVASRWVRSIHDAIKPGQKVVVKVIRVNKARRTVDVSLKRVTDSERRRRMAEWKRTQKAIKILEIVANKLGKSIDEAYENVAWKIEENYGGLMDAFEEALIRGEEFLRGLGIPEEWVKPLYEEIKRHVEVKKVKVFGTIVAQSLEKDGIERIRKVLKTVEEEARRSSNDVEVKLYTVGAPRYRVEIIAYDYKTAERALSLAVEKASKEAKNLNVKFEFIREWEKK